MKITSIKNPISEDQTKRFESSFNEQVMCGCKTVFETDSTDVDLVHNGFEGKNIFYNIIAKCPICKYKHNIGSITLTKQDVMDFVEYRKYLKTRRGELN